MAGWECAVIGDAAGRLSAMERPWLELGQRAKARPFQTFGWHAAWLATLGAASGYRPRVAVLHRGERLLGVLPLARRVHRGLRLLEWSAYGVTDYNDALLDPEVDPEAALAALWRAARARADLARLTHVLPGTPCDRFLAARGARSTAGETSWAVTLPGPDGAAWVASLSPGAHRNFHRYTRKLAEAGARFDVLSPAEPREPFLDALIDQKWA